MDVPSRRGFLFGLTSLVAAPAIVRATSIMPVKALPLTPLAVGGFQGRMDMLIQYRQEFIAAYEAAAAELFSFGSSKLIVSRDFPVFHVERG